MTAIDRRALLVLGAAAGAGSLGSPAALGQGRTPVRVGVIPIIGAAPLFVAEGEGWLRGAGLDLACMCDIRIASEKASFAESFARVGIIPGDGGAWLLPRVVGLSMAAEMSFTGDFLDAKQALEARLVSRVVPHEELLPAARALAARIARNPPDVLRMTKRLLREGQRMDLASLLEMSAAFQAIAPLATIERAAPGCAPTASRWSSSNGTTRRSVSTSVPIRSCRTATRPMSTCCPRMYVLVLR